MFYLVITIGQLQDINRLKRQGVSMTEAVGDHMSSPPIVVRRKAHVGEAAALMLAKNIHRLPVVDDEGKLIGIVSRTDIFRPLLNPKEDVYHALSIFDRVGPTIEGKNVLRDALQRSIDEDTASSVDELMSLTPSESWQVKYLYDGDCDICNQLMSTLKEKDGGKGRIKFVNIALMTYTPEDNEGVTYEDAMETIHVIKRDGTIVKGPEALRELYGVVGWGWIARLMAVPIVDKIVDAFYKIVAKYRLPMSGALTAMRRVTLTDAGIEHCVDDEEECEAVNW